MAITLTNVTSGFNLGVLNSNFQNIQSYINSQLLARADTGVAGEAEMYRDLDMNGFKILNADIDGSSITNDHALRVPTSEGPIPPLAEAEVRKGKVLGFSPVDGSATVFIPTSGSAADVLMQLASFGGDKLVASSYKGTVYTDYTPAEYFKSKTFGAGGSISSSREAVYNTEEDLWYAYTGTTFPVTVPAAVNASWVAVGKLNGYPIYDVRNWGLVGDDFTDNTAAIVQMINKTSGRNLNIKWPVGTFRYTDIGSVLYQRSSWTGEGGLSTILKCMNTTPGHIAFKVDAWPHPTDPNQPFIDMFNIKGIHFMGNANTSTVVDVQGLSRSIWEDVSFWGTQSTSSTGMFLRASSLNNFNNLICSKYRNTVGQTVNVPVTGLVITAGYRAGELQGSPSNNLFTSLYMEGMSRGLNMLYGDQNTFIGGSCEGHSDYGTNIALGCRYNTFVGMGNENLNATTGDFIDKGTYSKFINIYASQRFIAQGKNCTIDGGYFERMEIQGTAVSNEIKNITVNHWNTGAGGIFDSGIGTIVWNVYDSDIPDYLNTTDIRHSVTLTTTPVGGGTNGVWDNSTRLPVTFYIGGGTSAFTQALILRGGAGGDSVGIPLSGTQQIHLEAKDRISLTWSTGVTAPTCSYRAKNGYN